jgi:hypothetical protein
MWIFFNFVNLAAASPWLRRSWSPNYLVPVLQGIRISNFESNSILLSQKFFPVSPESLAEVMSCVEDGVASVSSDMVCSSVRNLSKRAELSVFRKRKDVLEEAKW